MEMAIVSHEPSHEGKKKLSERRMNIEEVGSLEVVGGKLDKSFC
jgi:hypothetical protein